MTEEPEHFNNYFRYEASIERAYYRALKAADEIKLRRKRDALNEERLELQRRKIEGTERPVLQSATASASQAPVATAIEIGTVPQSGEPHTPTTASTPGLLQDPTPRLSESPISVDKLSQKSGVQDQQLRHFLGL